MPMIRPLKRSTQSQQVLVTGGSGFLGMYCILRLLDLGYRVRCTVRSLTREPEVRRTLEQMGASSIGASLSFIEADLSADPGWDDAAAGSSYVLHVASPFSVGQKDGNIDTIGIARSGTLRVLRAAHEAKVKRLVITSSFVTMSYARQMDTAELTEADWSDLSIPTLTAYVRSKTSSRKRCLGFCEAKRWARAYSSKPDGDIGAGHVPRLFSVNFTHPRYAGRKSAVSSEAFLRDRGRPRRRRSTHSRYDRSCSKWRAVRCNSG